MAASVQLTRQESKVAIYNQSGKKCVELETILDDFFSALEGKGSGPRNQRSKQPLPTPTAPIGPPVAASLQLISAGEHGGMGRGASCSRPECKVAVYTQPPKDFAKRGDFHFNYYLQGII